MIMIGVLFIFVWLIASFIIAVDLFKKGTVIGCLSVILLPIVPFYWVIKGYSGNKKLFGVILYGSVIIGFGTIGYQFFSASNQLKPMIKQSASIGFDFSLNSISSSDGQNYYTIVSDEVYKPSKNFTSVEEMLQVMIEEKINLLSSFYPIGLKEGTIIRVAIPTESGFMAVFEITKQNNIIKAYTSNSNEL